MSFFLLLFSALSHSREYLPSSVVTQPPSYGFYSLPGSQQPGPLIAFGENIIDKGQFELFFEPNYLNDTSHQHYLSLPIAGLYGLSDVASLYITVPFAGLNKIGPYHSSGIEDLFVQGELAFYNAGNSRYTEQATLVSNVSIPSGSFTKLPPTGLGAPSFFLGATYQRIYLDWMFFTSPGATWFNTHDNFLFGTEYLYQFGIVRNIKSEPNHYIFAATLEMDGNYKNHSRYLNVPIADSGGNTISLTPSLWFSTQQLTLQLGVALPVVEALNGEQSRSNYYVVGIVAWTFN